MIKNVFSRRLLSSVVFFSLLAFGAGCKRTKSPLLNSPGGGVTSVSLTVPQIDTSKSPENKIFVSVVDNNSSFVTDFQLGNFSIVEGGTPGVPIEVGRSIDPLWVVIVIDRSGSMVSSATVTTSRNEEATIGATALVNALSATDQCAIVEFDDTIEVKADFTTDKTVLTNAISNFTRAGGTALRDAVVRGADILSGKSGRQLLVLMTDGDDTASTGAPTPQEAARRINIKGASANTIGIGGGLSAEGTAALQLIADETGGTATFSASGAGLSPILLSLLNKYNNLVYIKYRKRAGGTGNRVSVYLNYGSLTTTNFKSL